MYNSYWDNFSAYIYVVQAFVGMLCLKSVGGRTIRVANSSVFDFSSMLLVIVWTFFATFRLVNWGIGGTDAMNYVDFFVNSWGVFDETMEHTASDFAFLWINRCIRFFTADFHVFFAIVYGFIAYSIISFTKHFTNKDFCFIPLVLAFYLYLRGYNTLRSNLSIAFILLGMVNVSEEKYKLAYFYMLCSALTHKAGVMFAMVIPYLHFAIKRSVKIKYLVLASCLMFVIASSVREYFIAYASLYDLGGAYKSYAVSAGESDGFLNGFVECFMQYVLVVVVLLSTKKIRKVAVMQGQSFANVVNMLLYICYFDMMLIPLNVALGIWRGYEFLYIPRLCMWGCVIFVFTRNLRKISRLCVYSLVLLYFITWFVFRLNRTYEASDLMPYVLNL